jgi:hypothetical protein
MRYPGSIFLFAFHSAALFCSLAGLLVAGMALILPEADWERMLRGAVLFVVSSLIARFADRALQETDGV